MNDSAYITLRIRELADEVPGFKTVVFEDGHHIDYKAGQYLTFIKQLGNKEIRRSYSITSSPALNEPLSIGIKRIDNGIFSRWFIDTAKPGDTVQTIGSGGFFVLPDDVNSYKQLFFFAAGSGITPMFSLIKTALVQYPTLELVLIYSNHSHSSAVYLRHLEALQQQYAGRLHAVFLFSNTPQLVKARLHKELIVEILDEFAVSHRDKMLCYICGPENYMRMCTYTLEEAAIPPANIRRETFIVDKNPKINLAPPDKASHKATLIKAGRETEFLVTYPDSILKSAKKAGLQLPYSCETGKCGSCVARCVEGRVWHSYNEVLTEADLAKGLVLTCVGHPIYGDIRLEM